MTSIAGNRAPRAQRRPLRPRAVGGRAGAAAGAA